MAFAILGFPNGQVVNRIDAMGEEPLAQRVALIQGDETEKNRKISLVQTGFSSVRPHLLLY